MRNSRLVMAGVALLAGAWAGQAAAATCRDPAGFDHFLGDLRREAAAQGIPQNAISAALDGVSYDASIVSRDKGQRVFKQTFEEFSGRMISKFRLSKGASLIRQYGPTLQR